uniref:P-type domain-containing protein n=1 Tax=Sphaeramia orbicularis TaxID=375764 RepID=A0A673C4Q4_9TELE
MLTYDRLVHYAAQNNAGKRLCPHPNNSNQSSTYDKCTMAPENHFDCARDGVLSQKECEDRGCCCAPLPDTAGPPWCFYLHLYPGYIMGPLSPTRRGQASTLTRAKPSYLPKDISTLHLEVIEDSAEKQHSLHLKRPVKDPSYPWYEVQLPGEPHSGAHGKTDSQDTFYHTEFHPDPFGFIVWRKSNGRVM